MRILYFYQYFGTPKGSWSTRVYEMTRRWVEAGHDVTVITSPYDKSDIKGNGLISTQSIAGINITVINFKQSNKHSFLHRVFTFVAFSITSILFALFKRYDIAIASSGPITIGLPLLFAKYLRGKKVVFEVRDVWPEGAIQLGILRNRGLQKLAYWFEKRCYTASIFIVACSNGMAESILTRFSKLKVMVIPNASDIELFSTKIDTGFSLPTWAIGKKIIIYTGSLGLIDNCIEFINLAQELQKRKNTEVVIVLIGEGAEKKDLVNLAKQKKLSNLYFLNLMPKNELSKWLQSSHAATLTIKDIPMLHACSPNKIFDAFAASKPIIQTSQGWIKKLIADENCGITIMPNSPQEFANAVEKICTNNEMHTILCENSEYVAKTHFNRDTLAKKMVNGLENAVYKRFNDKDFYSYPLESDRK